MTRSQQEMIARFDKRFSEADKALEEARKLIADMKGQINRG